MFYLGSEKEKTTGNVKFKGLIVGTTLKHRVTGLKDEITEVVRGGFVLKNADGPFTKSYIFKNFQLK